MNDPKKAVPRLSSKAPKAAWWQVYAMLPLLGAAFLFEMRLPLTNTEHIIAQLAILFLIYLFIHGWLRANSRALMGLEEEQGEWKIKVYEIPPVQQAASEVGHPRFRLPEAGLKGLLDDTFEMEVPEKASSVFSKEHAVPRKE